MTDEDSSCCSCTGHYDGRHYIPAYIWYILGFLSIALLLESIFLIFVLIKTKFIKIYSILGCQNNKSTSIPEKLEAADARSQPWENKSIRRLNLDRNNSEVNNEDKNNRILKRQDSSITTISDYITLRAPKKADGSGNISPKIMKTVMKDMPIIKPEQMSEICKEVLKRRHVIDDTKSSLQNIDQLVKEDMPEDQVVIKYASTPELDVYDVVPQTPRTFKTTGMEKNESPDTIEKPSNENSVNDKPEANHDIYDFPKESNGKPDTNCDIYDFPKESNGKPDTNCDIYDFPKESNSNALEVSDIYDSPIRGKTTIQSGDVVPYFSSTNLSVGFKEAEGKPNYAHLSEISSDHGARNSQREDYDDPRKIRDGTEMYINANDNLFTVTEKSATNG